MRCKMKLSRIILGLILIISIVTVVQAIPPQVSYNSMTGNATNGYTTNYSSAYDGSYLGYKLFDGDLTADNGWATSAGVTSGWVWQQFPTAKIVTNYTIYGYWNPTTMPNTWTFSGSNGGGETTLDSHSGVTWSANENKTFSFANTNQYLRYNLTISSINGGGNVLMREMYFYGNNPPLASFTANTTGGYSPLPVLLTDTSTNNPTSWEYGAKNVTGNNTWIPIGTTQNLATTLPVGNWSLRLNATTAGGTNTSTQTTFVNVSALLGPGVSFSVNQTVGVNPLAISLNDTSTGSPTMWNTSWGDAADSWTNQTTFPPTNISHVYSTAGNYTITHYAANAYGTGSATATITVWGAANSVLSLFNAAGTAPHTTYLYDTSTNLTPGPVTYYTSLGEGNTSTESAFYYTWNETGTYAVNHSVNNGLSTSWYNQTVTVGTPTPPVVAPVASFYGGPQLGAVPLTVFFTDVSNNTPTSWNWSMGDGTYYETQNPSHVYTGSGFFTVNLTATNSAGSNTTSQNNFVMVY